jgi:hypothetical protein
MITPPPERPFAPRGTAVPLLVVLPRLRPSPLDVEPEDVLAVEPPLELDVEPLDEGAGAGAEGTAVPVDGVSAPLECCASAAAGTARAPIRTADVRYRVICTCLSYRFLATRLPIVAPENIQKISRCHVPDVIELMQGVLLWVDGRIDSKLPS